MANEQSITRFINPSFDDVQQTLGILRFESETDWNQTINGLTFQGGKILDPGGNGGQVNFSSPYTKQVLFVVAFPIDSTGTHNVNATSINLTGFRINNNHGGSVNYLWLAIGL
jgi:hypothetical protein